MLNLGSPFSLKRRRRIGIVRFVAPRSAQLQPSRGLVEVLKIDSIERPTED
jgi:hypothetical protein